MHWSQFRCFNNFNTCFQVFELGESKKSFRNVCHLLLRNITHLQDVQLKMLRVFLLPPSSSSSFTQTWGSGGRGGEREKKHCSKKKPLLPEISSPPPSINHRRRMGETEKKRREERGPYVVIQERRRGKHLSLPLCFLVDGCRLLLLLLPQRF